MTETKKFLERSIAILLIVIVLFGFVFEFEIELVAALLVYSGTVNLGYTFLKYLNKKNDIED